MTDTLDASTKALFDAKNFAHVSIVRDDGTAQTVVVWVDTDGERLRVNSAEGRLWPKLLRKAGRATISVANGDNPYEFASVTAKLVEDTHEGADAHIDALAKKYMDADSYPFRQEGEQRITFVLEPERVAHQGA